MLSVSVLKREGFLHMANPGLHRDMINHFIQQQMFKEASEIIISHMALPNFRTQALYTALHHCISQMPEDQRPDYPENSTVAYALEHL